MENINWYISNRKYKFIDVGLDSGQSHSVMRSNLSLVY